MSWLSRFANVFRSSGVDDAVDDEIAFHIEAKVRDLVAGGLPRDDAEALARRQFGSRLRLREESRDVKLLPWLDSLVRDVRMAARLLRKSRLVSIATMLSLSLALGACIAAFSLVDALMLRPLPVRDPQHLIQLTVPTEPDRPNSDTFSDPLFQRLRAAGRGRIDRSRSAIPNGRASPSRHRARRGSVSGWSSCPATRSPGSESSRYSAA